MAQATLDIGDPAPLLKPARWLKGDPVPEFRKGQVYVVEFWATWCGPCKAAMPKISAMARRYGKQVTFIGINAAEPTEMAKIADFVKSQGANMGYTVAADGPADHTGADWMGAAGETGIPVAFVVNPNRQIAWIGHSPEELDKVLPGVIAGTHNLVAARQSRAANRDPRDAVNIAMGDGDYAKAIAIIDAQLAKTPEAAPNWALPLYTSLAHTDLPRLKRQVKADLARSADDFTIYNMTTLALVMSSGLAAGVYRFGMEIAEEGVRQLDEPQAGQRLMLLARGAEIAMKADDPTRAVDLQSRAIQAAADAPNCTAERKAELQSDLLKYQAAARAKSGAPGR